MYLLMSSGIKSDNLCDRGGSKGDIFVLLANF
jgi:hypothetical protein